jgi:hypothetical protein
MVQSRKLGQDSNNFLIAFDAADQQSNVDLRKIGDDASCDLFLAIVNDLITPHNWHSVRQVSHAYR